MNHSLSQRAGERGECAAHHGTFGPLQHEGVVHDAGSRFDIVACIAGERTPGSAIQGECNTDPCVDGDGAVAKVMDGALQSGRILFGCCRVDDQVRSEIAFEGLIGERNRIVEIRLRVGPWESDDAQHGAEELCGETHVVAARGIEIGDERDRPGAVGQDLSIGVIGDGLRVTIRGTGVVGLPISDL